MEKNREETIELSKDLMMVLKDRWFLNMSMPLNAYKLNETSVDELPYDIMTATLKNGDSGVLKHGAHRSIPDFYFLANIANLLQNEDNYILFNDELNPIATEDYGIDPRDIDIIHEKYNLDR